MSGSTQSGRSDIPRETVLHAWHVAAGAGMHEFGGYDMPIQYDGILTEHLATRRSAGLFDTSHMGRFWLRGPQAVPFLRRVLTHDAARLDPGWAHYTLLADAQGGAVDDAFLYRLEAEEFVLVVNASNRARDWDWLQESTGAFPGLQLADRSEETAMMALQGAAGERVLADLLASGGRGALPVVQRNALARVELDGVPVIVARTGYTGEPRSLELFVTAERAVALWERILEAGRDLGVVPVGLGARDTLRLEAGLPLYGHELGTGPDGQAIPIMALMSLAARAVDLEDPGRRFIGREALEAQRVPYRVRKLAVVDAAGRGPGTNPVRQGHQVFLEDRPVGWITSGTVVPHWRFGPDGKPGPESGRRAIALAYVDACVRVRRRGTPVQVDKGRGRRVSALLVRTQMRVEDEHVRAVLYPQGAPA